MTRNEEEDMNSMEDAEDSDSQMRSVHHDKRRTGSPLRMVVIALVLIFVALFVVSKFTRWNVLGMQSWQYKGYQAVFLTNGQVYFGNVAKENSETVLIKDIFYLQIVPTPGLQSSQTAGVSSPQTQQQQQPQVTLVKLGNELHGPEDLMRVERRQILFIENLKSDSQVVRAITEYQKQIGKK